MDELISRLMAEADIGEPQARGAVGIVLAFLAREAPPGPVERVLEAVPGARDLLAAQPADHPLPEDTRHLGGMARLMGVADRMMAAGLTMAQVQGAIREVVAFARGRAGDAAVDEIVAGVPGLRHLL